jgi:hypothetical protein
MSKSRKRTSPGRARNETNTKNAKVESLAAGDGRRHR